MGFRSWINECTTAYMNHNPLPQGGLDVMMRRTIKGEYLFTVAIGKAIGDMFLDTHERATDFSWPVNGCAVDIVGCAEASQVRSLIGTLLDYGAGAVMFEELFTPGDKNEIDIHTIGKLVSIRKGRATEGETEAIRDVKERGSRFIDVSS